MPCGNLFFYTEGSRFSRNCVFPDHYPSLFIQVLDALTQESPRRRSVSTEKELSECGRQGPAGETISEVVIDLVNVLAT